MILLWQQEQKKFHYTLLKLNTNIEKSTGTQLTLLSRQEFNLKEKELITDKIGAQNEITILTARQTLRLIDNSKAEW